MYYLNSIWNATYSCYVICLWIYYIWLYMYTIFFSLLSVDGHVGWFHNLAVNITAMIMSTKISLTYWFQTLWLATQKWDCWSNGNSIYSVWGNLHSFTFLAAVLKGSFSCVLTHIYFFHLFDSSHSDSTPWGSLAPEASFLWLCTLGNSCWWCK